MRSGHIPRGVCRAILKGATEQIKADHPLVAGCYGVQGATDDAEAVLHSQGHAEATAGYIATISQGKF